jgi:hypothetical protein
MISHQFTGAQEPKMNDVVDSTLRNDMLEILNRQKRAYIAEGEVSAAVRIDRLDRSVALLKKYGPRFCTTMAGDFGHRSIEQSKLTDVDASIVWLPSQDRIPTAGGCRLH